MFSFHKPKIYRSNLGCCICKAKSSSSRFTDSKKYENEFERCFRIQEKRSGEICNACVLLVKRWKKLSPENRTTKHWHHVVDARAGPGTKLTGNRRLVGSSSSSGRHEDGSSNKQKLSSRTDNVLPLSSSQVSNQASSSSSSSSSAAAASSSSSSAATTCSVSHAGSSQSATGRRSNSFSNKARAIDTNVTTFTFGEPADHRRSYMSVGPAGYLSPSSSASVSFAKPQSALNSSAFESVIKRFRQRQQQQQLAAQRRQLNRKQRLQSPAFVRSQKLPTQKSEESKEEIQRAEDKLNVANAPAKRLKRCSESIGSITIDGVKASSILDSSLWRKEKICCGIIFRGLYNEVVVFPKLLKPCQCRTNALKLKLKLKGANPVEEAMETSDEASPPHRATKSGSISSCDSNTSGTGSMDPQLEELRKKHTIQRRKSNLRVADEEVGVTTGSAAEPVARPEPVRPRLLAKRQQPLTGNRAGKRLNDNDSTISSASSSAFSSRVGDVKSLGSDTASQQAHSPGGSSSDSSSRLLLMDDGLLLDDEDVESNTDASSSVESITEVERKKSTSGVVGAAMG